MTGDQILEPEQLRRYADAIVKASLGVKKGDTLVVIGEPAHREGLLAVVEAGYRAGATIVDLDYTDALAARAKLEHGTAEARGAVSPWRLTVCRELVKPTGARAVLTGVANPGYLDGIPAQRIADSQARIAEQTMFFHRANLDMRARWTGAAWPTDHWATQVYPELSTLEGKRRLAQDFLSFCRLTDADGAGSRGWLEHVRALARRSAKLTKRGFTALELRGPGTELSVKLAAGTRWLGGQEETPSGAKIAPNMPTEESYTSPHADGTNGSFTCTFPLTFQGRQIDGIRGEFRNGRLVRLDCDGAEDRKRLAAYIDSDPSGNGRRLGEVALVDATSRIGRTGRTYFHTLLDENAAAHIAFGAGFGGTRPGSKRGLNNSTIHLDVMIGGPDFEVTGIAANGRRSPLISGGLWQL
ncbi:MAG TPA: aminopeptidase [Gaiellaceae bacterium]